MGVCVAAIVWDLKERSNPTRPYPFLTCAKTMSKMVPAAAVMMFLSDLYSKLDALVDEFGVWKVGLRQ